MSKKAQSLYQAVMRFSTNRFEIFGEHSCAIIPSCGRTLFLALLIVLTGLTAGESSSTIQAATYRTDNFVVRASNSSFAKKVGDTAERLRAELSMLWLGQKLPKWGNPCEVFTKTGDEVAAGGETTFTFSNGEVYDWKMTVQGSEERILDSVLPHEITHTIIASYFRAPAPRWLDEGMATSVEARGERMRYRKMLVEFLHTDRGIAFNHMVSLKDYPEDLTPFYSQVFSVCEYLILLGGRQRLIEFAREGSETKNWDAALKKYYQCDSLGCLQRDWVEWVREWEKNNQPIDLPPTRKLREFNPLEDEGIIIAHNERLAISHPGSKESAPSSVPMGDFNPAGRFWDNLQISGKQRDKTSWNDSIARAQNVDQRNDSNRPLNNFPSFGRLNASNVAKKNDRVAPETSINQQIATGNRLHPSYAVASSCEKQDKPTSDVFCRNILTNGAGSATKHEGGRIY